MRSALGIVMGVCALSCQSHVRPILVGFEVWTATASGTPPGGGAVLINPSADGSISLRLDSWYSLRGDFQMPDRADRCLYRPVRYSWHVADPVAEKQSPFPCYPGTGGILAREILVDTSRQDVAASQAAGVPPAFLFEIREYDAASENFLYEGSSRSVPVRFEEPASK